MWKVSEGQVGFKPTTLLRRGVYIFIFLEHLLLSVQVFTNNALNLKGFLQKRHI